MKSEKFRQTRKQEFRLRREKGKEEKVKPERM
jgi:hypothetical protein